MKTTYKFFEFLNEETKEVTKQLLSTDALEAYLKDNPTLICTSLPTTNGQAPALVTMLGMGKIDNGFRDVLNKVAKGSPRNNMNIR